MQEQLRLTVPVTEVNRMVIIKIIDNIDVVLPSIKTIGIEYKKLIPHKSGCDFLVEATRVELVSEIVSTGTSPGAVHGLQFLHYNAHEQAL